MKNKWFVGIALASMLFLSGCNAYKNESQTTTSEVKAPTELTLYVVRHGKTMLNTTSGSGVVRCSINKTR